MKRTVPGALSLLFLVLACLSFSACRNEETSTAEEKETAETHTETLEKTYADPDLDTVEIGNQDEAIEAAEILEHCLLWEGFSDKGSLTMADAYKVSEIKSEADLEKYRAVFPNLTDEDAKNLSASGKSKTLLVEIMGRQSNCSYTLTSVNIAGTAIDVSIFETEEDVEQPEYTFLLLHIPAEYYHSEEIRISFTE